MCRSRQSTSSPPLSRFQRGLSHVDSKLSVWQAGILRRRPNQCDGVVRNTVASNATNHGRTSCRAVRSIVRASRERSDRQCCCSDKRLVGGVYCD